jgi:probable F420-dependent oxidoreductase
MHRFRFGLMLERFESPGSVLELARQAEAAGFSTLLVRDHLIAEPFGPAYAPMTTLAAVAQATSTLRIGTLVYSNDFRHPAVLAKEATTLDQLSGGRFELGLGAGFLREEYERTGFTFDANSVRVDRFEEAVGVLDNLLRGRTVTHTGRHYSFDEYTNFPPPHQQPRPPILIGGAGRRMLSIAAQHADIVGILPAPLSRGKLVDPVESRLVQSVDRQIDIVRQAAGPRFAQLELSVFATFAPASDRIDAARQLAQQRGWQDVPAEAVLDMPSVLIGSEDQMIDDLQRRRERFGLSYIVVRDRQLSEAAPLVARLTDT